LLLGIRARDAGQRGRGRERRERPGQARPVSALLPEPGQAESRGDRQRRDRGRAVAVGDEDRDHRGRIQQKEQPRRAQLPATRGQPEQGEGQEQPEGESEPAGLPEQRLQDGRGFAQRVEVVVAGDLPRAEEAGGLLQQPGREGAGLGAGVPGDLVPEVVGLIPDVRKARALRLADQLHPLDAGADGDRFDPSRVVAEVKVQAGAGGERGEPARVLAAERRRRQEDGQQAHRQRAGRVQAGLPAVPPDPEGGEPQARAERKGQECRPGERGQAAGDAQRRERPGPRLGLRALEQPEQQGGPEHGPALRKQVGFQGDHGPVQGQDQPRRDGREAPAQPAREKVDQDTGRRAQHGLEHPRREQRGAECAENHGKPERVEDRLPEQRLARRRAGRQRPGLVGVGSRVDNGNAVQRVGVEGKQDRQPGEQGDEEDRRRAAAREKAAGRCRGWVHAGPTLLPSAGRR